MTVDAQVESLLNELNRINGDIVQSRLIDWSNGRSSGMPGHSQVLVEPDFTQTVIQLCDTAQSVIRATHPAGQPAFKQDENDRESLRDNIQIRWGDNILVIMPDSPAQLILCVVMRKHGVIGLALLDMWRTLKQIRTVLNT